MQTFTGSRDRVVSIDGQPYEASQAIVDSLQATQSAFDQLALDGPVDAIELAALVEAMLLVAPAPASIDELAAGAGVLASAIEAVVTAWETSSSGGWVIQRHGGRVQLATAPRFAVHVRRFLGLEREAKLSSAALESLAIIAYQQPVTRGEIEAVRGVDCAGVLATLFNRGLIEQTGRLTTPGNPIQYGTTAEFLLHFGLGALSELPSLGTLDDRDALTTLTATVTSAGFDTQPSSAISSRDA